MEASRLLFLEPLFHGVCSDENSEGRGACHLDLDIFQLDHDGMYL